MRNGQVAALRYAHPEDSRRRWAIVVAIAGMIGLASVSSAWAAGSPWKIIPTATSDGGDGTLEDVQGVPGTNAAWAVGWSPAFLQPIIEQHVGAASNPWTIVPSPTFDSGGALNAVTALSAHDAWAVGTFSDGSQGRALTEHWDGNSWTAIPNPVASQADLALLSVSAVSASDVWAAGYYTPTSQPQPLVLHWDGSLWTQVATPDLGDIKSFLFDSTSVPGTNEIWIVGTTYTTQTQSSDVFLHWNGAGWDPPISIPAAPQNGLRGVAAASPANVWAVGTAFPSTGGEIALTYHYDGHRWSRVPAPATGQPIDQLSDVAFSRTGEVWAVGRSSDHIVASSLIMRFVDSKWKIVASPTPQQDTELQSISSDGSAAGLWAIGFDGDGSGTVLPLALHYPGL